ncbi:TPA: hypothetical protein N0F65_007804 [Lagenidium giganteum]|uniref:PH domain-containing protein n=1 Tax=Lagenidium giganteum TaxID=4803 RepID=A0AAV2Z458_9STRA|nr:TPA: hypothetical protein N0F65_007804 [Lagenidium giganteum]
MAPVSFRMMRGNSSSSSIGNNLDASGDSDNDIQMQGWMRKQKETLRSWGRRYFTLTGKVLTYYDSEDTNRAPRGVLEFQDVQPLTTENNGLSLHLVGGKEVRLIADTHIAYTAWMSVLSAALKKPTTKKSSHTCKDGWAHCLADEDVWTRYFIVIKNDSFSCYESEEEEAELALSGLVRSASEWDGKRFGLVVGLNKGRKIKLCFDSTEEKMSWLLTLEFAVSYGKERLKKELKKEASMKATAAAEANPVSSTEAAAAGGDDDGVWI